MMRRATTALAAFAQTRANVLQATVGLALIVAGVATWSLGLALIAAGVPLFVLALWGRRLVR